MHATRTFDRTRYSADVVDEALKTFISALPSENTPHYYSELSVTNGQMSWQYDSYDEFLAEHREPHDSYSLSIWGKGDGYYMNVWQTSYLSTSVKVEAPDRESILRVMSVFVKYADASFVPAPAKKVPPAPKPRPPRIFIGHGGNEQWRDLKDHLQDQQGYEVEVFESGARAGHTARDVLSQMLTKSAFALIVLTGENEGADGDLYARQNVVHEAGLFQGALGFSRAIVLVEDGVTLFSNLDGIQQIRFPKNGIRETFGDVLATLRREFGPVPLQQS